jgi:hypothetical protein
MINSLHFMGSSARDAEEGRQRYQKVSMLRFRVKEAIGLM